MGRIDPTQLEAVQEATDLLSLVRSRVVLKRRGSRWVGLCPFHNEKTPSFGVTPSRRIWHCFGCGETGDAIDWLRLTEGLDFREAAEQLAERAGVLLETRPGDDKAAALRNDVLHINALAARHYVEALGSDAAADARAELERRGLPLDVASAWGLGYAGRDLLPALRAAKVLRAPVQASRLVTELEDDRGRRVVPFFRHRLVFPIRRRHDGAVLGFGGRALSEKARAKYMNTPATPAYDKSRVLYGLDMAWPSILKRRSVVIAEGYFDVIALHRSGVSEAVAPCGTALTEAQVRTVARTAEQAVLCLDGDDAGLRAAGRAIPLLLAAGLRVRVVLYDGGTDPDDVLRSAGPVALRDRVGAAVDAVAWWIGLHAAQGAAGLDAVRPLLLAARPGDRGAIRSLIRSEFGVDPDAGVNKPTPEETTRAQDDGAQAEVTGAERAVVDLVVSEPAAASALLAAPWAPPIGDDVRRLVKDVADGGAATSVLRAATPRLRAPLGEAFASPPPPAAVRRELRRYSLDPGDPPSSEDLATPAGRLRAAVARAEHARRAAVLRRFA